MLEERLVVNDVFRRHKILRNLSTILFKYAQRNMSMCVRCNHTRMPVFLGHVYAFGFRASSALSSAVKRQSNESTANICKTSPQVWNLQSTAVAVVDAATVAIVVAVAVAGPASVARCAPFIKGDNSSRKLRPATGWIVLRHGSCLASSCFVHSTTNPLHNFRDIYVCYVANRIETRLHNTETGNIW